MMSDPLCVVAHVDGGARGNPGPAAGAFVIRDGSDGIAISQAGVFLGKTTNNVAEYRGLILALAAAAELKADQVKVFSDSQLMVRQMNGLYRVKSENIKPLFEQACQLQSRFSKCTFRHISREENKEADLLVNQAINLKRDV